MAYLVCSCTRFRPPRIWVQRLGVFAFLAGVFGRLGFVVQAEPISFQFEATISEVQGDVAALNLPFTLVVGQQIAGRYTFQSEEDLLDIFLHHERGKHGQVSLIIDGIEIDAATNFGSLNSAGVLDPPIAGPTSAIYLDYSSPTDVVPGWPGTVAGHPWSQRLILLGAEGTITDPNQLLDVDIWNQLTLFRRLDLQFGYPNTVSVRATVNDFAVPEPFSVLLVCEMILARLVCGRPF